MAMLGRIAVGLASFCLLPLLIWCLALYIWDVAYIDPVLGSPSTDPHGRGVEGAVDLFNIGLFVVVLLSALGAVLAVLATYRENWNAEFVITSLAFLIFSGVTVANYMSIDTVLTRDTQAILNVLLLGTAVSVIVLVQKYLTKIKILALYIIAIFGLFLAMYAFVATPGWYTISYLSWRLGAGELKDLEQVANAIGGIGSVLAVLGLQWKSGILQRQ
jgi:hypothetical protein